MKNPVIDRIQRAICRHYGIEQKELFSRKRTAHLVHVRHLTIWAAHEACFGNSMSDIGRAFGRTSGLVIHALQSIKNQCDTSKRFRDEADCVLTLARAEVTASQVSATNEIATPAPAAK